MIIPRTTTSKKYPVFIRTHKTLAKFAKRQRTIFPRIGLKNCKEVFRGETIVFSSSGKDGLWDKATMSMRGISSCQAWSGSYRRRLIGTMIDPYAGIIYSLTGKDTKKGMGMKQRAIVRFVLPNTGSKKKPAIFIERVYFNYNEHCNPQGMNIFAAFIRAKVGKKYDVVTQSYGYSIPLTTAVKNIREDSRSYRDSGIHYDQIKGYTSPVRAKLP